MQPRRAHTGLIAIVLIAIIALSSYGAAAREAGGKKPTYDCSKGCTFTTRPVCGSDGEWYQNECLAICSGDVKLADIVLCQDKPLPFRDNRPGPAGAESAVFNGSALDVVPLKVVNQFLQDGFRYVGRIRLAHDLGPRPEPAETQPVPEKERDGSWKVKAVRCTSDGDVYVGSLKVPTKPAKLDSYTPPWMNLARPFPGLDANSTLAEFASSLGIIPSPSALRNATRRAAAAARGNGSFLAPRTGGKAEKDKRRLESLLSDFLAFFQTNKQQQAAAAAPAAAAAAAVAAAEAAQSPNGNARSLKELVGSDDRHGCQRGFPYTSIGQIQVVDNTGLYICTGTLIAPDKVLTAGHCVWNIKRGSFYYNLNYAPGRFRDGDKIVNPWGVVPWKSVTVFDSFKKNPSTWDVAVVTLAKPLGSLTGYMGVAAGCGRNLQLTTAGYPQDKAQGTCMAATCTQSRLECDNPTNPHVCDTKMGMSGSPLWDGKNRVRLIHVAGIEGRAENRATTLTQFLVNAVSKW